MVIWDRVVAQVEGRDVHRRAIATHTVAEMLATTLALLVDLN